MGPKTLVTKEQVLSGAELIRQLPAGGVVVTGAAWAKTEDDGQPYLYVVSPTVEQAGPLEAAHRLVRVLNELDRVLTDPFDRLDPFAIKLIGSAEPLARGIAEHYHRFNDERHTWHGGSVLGPVSIEGAYIYPATMFTHPAGQPGSV